MPRRVVTEELKQFVKDNYLKMSAPQIKEKTGMSFATIAKIKKEFGLVIPHELKVEWRRQAQLKSRRTSYTKEEDDFIRANYLNIPMKKLAREMGRSECGIKGRMKHMNLVIPRKIIQQRIMDSRLKKGHIPPNKGLRQVEYMSADAIERTKATRFKKGQKIYNEKKNGDISLRKDKNGQTYKYIRIGKRNWILYHRMIWEQKHGKIPPKHNIIFKDGNSLNCELSNLKMVSDAELMKMNSIHNYPEDIKNVIRLKAKLNNIIKKKENA